MARIEVKALGPIDPYSVPLPNGTEVTTTVDRPLGDGPRVVPQGAVGRIVRSDGERVWVLVVGVGEIELARGEVVPRKLGQVRFAARRAAVEEALRPCVILESVVGSRAWGLSDEHSDTDHRGVFLLPFPWTTGLADRAEVIVSADGGATYWEIERTIRQLLRADPNTLEVLFVPDVRVLDPVGDRLLAARDAFVSTDVYGSFGRYALSQAKKLGQSARLAEHRTLMLEWLRKTPDLGLDALAVRLAAEAMGADDAPSVHRAKQYIKQLYRSMFDQGLLEANDLASLASFARESAADFDLPRELRPKNAYNLLRLVALAVDWLRTGRPQLFVRDPLREQLLAIKHGEVSLATSLAWTEAMASQLEDARANSPLPIRPDYARADAILREAREEGARRWIDRQPGPWGTNAPDPPTPEEREE